MGFFVVLLLLLLQGSIQKNRTTFYPCLETLHESSITTHSTVYLEKASRDRFSLSFLLGF